jgi:ferredoxin
MRPTVDITRCEGNGICAGVAPEIFTVNENDQAEVLEDDIPPSLEANARYAVMSCPVSALSIQE